MNAPRILVVDDEPDMRWVLSDLFQGAGFQVVTAQDGQRALAELARHDVDVVLSDVRMAGGDGVQLLRDVRARDPDLPVVLLSAAEDLETAVGAMKLGAYDYLAKPFDRHRLLDAVRRAAEKRQLTHQVRDLRGRLGVDLGASPAAAELDRMLSVVAGHTRVAVLLVGESGVGKEIAAREIHRRSAHADGPFVAIDCGAVPESLLESQLFGHKRGAFTGATHDRQGLFTQADGGTLFLDEIGNLPLALQPRLLRALQERSVVPVGGDQPIPFSARLLCATNSDLATAVHGGTFRLDLFHRIAEFRIELPPLRSRPLDVLHFARRFLAEAQTEFGGHVRNFTPAAERALTAHTWPGNLRQLRNTVRRAALMQSGEAIDVDDLDLDVREPAARFDTHHESVEPLAERLRRAMDVLEAQVLRETLDHFGGNKAAAARALRIDYTTLHRKLKRHGLSAMADVP